MSGAAAQRSTHERLSYWRLKLAAIAALVLGRREAALHCFDAMIQRWPTDAYALASRAHVLAQRGRKEEALRDAQALVTAHPRRSAGNWFNLAFLLEATDRLADAEQAFRRAIELDPKLDRAWYGLSLVLIRQRRLDEAVTSLTRNTELQPMSPYGWYQLARVHFERQQPEEARRIIRHLKGFEPKVAAQLERETGLAA
ncbi:MAG TPA: tetratricopeptide repeat protein [Burkholderiaceae bacterium]|nr:tetratricopeptide repeat protein [Burkholderiaceae bacterium]